MKTQIIHLEPHDDLASVLDKLKRTKAERLILIWPGRNRVLTERLDLRLIQRSAAKRGLQLGFVSLDPDVQAHARSLQIPLFEDLNNLHREAWPEIAVRESQSGERHNQREEIEQLRSQLETTKSRPFPRAAGWSLFALALIALVSLVFLLIPSATIEIDPLRDAADRSLSIAANASENDPGNVLRVDRVRLEGSVRIPTSGISSQPGEFARGTAEFTNISDERVTVPAGTTIREPGSSQLYFITSTSIVLPGEEGSSQSVEIIASQPGPGGNRPPGRISAVDGELGLRVSVINPQATSGGSVTTSSAVAAADLTQAREELSADLRMRARELILANMLPQEELLVESLIIQEILTESFDRSIGDIADTLGLEMSVIARATLIDTEQLEERVLADLSILEGPGKSLVPESLAFERIRLNDFENLNEAVLQIEVSYQLFEVVDKAAIARLARGMQPLRAQRQIGDRFPRVIFRIDIKPDWYPILPFFEPQIDVKYTWEPQS